MSALASAPLRTLAFGDRAAGVWGLVWSGPETLAAFGELDGAAGAATTPATLVTGDDGWLVEIGSGAGALRVGARGAASEPAGSGCAQLCLVEGELSLGGSARGVSSPGVRVEAPLPELAELEALRLVLAWFDDDQGMAVSAARPRGAPGQERDQLHATVLGPERDVEAHEARLSTTYAAGGAPARVGLELWLPGEGEDEEYPVRAAGEALGARAALQGTAVRVDVTALLAHRGGHDGLAAYAIARAR